MKKLSSAACAAALAVPLLAAVPAQADITYAGCDTETFSKTVKQKGKFKYRIMQPATACAEHQSTPGGLCQMLNGFDSMPSSAEIKVGKNVTSSRLWDAGTPAQQPPWSSCATYTTVHGSPYVTVSYSGRFSAVIKGKTLFAKPGLTVRFSGTSTGESIVSFKRTGQWDFKKPKKSSTGG